jgi:PAS domain S-box-containing protein
MKTVTVSNVKKNIAPDLGDDLLKLLPESNPGLVAVISDSMDIHYLNAQFRHFLGYSLDDVKEEGLSFCDILEPYQREHLAYQLNNVKENVSERSAYSIYQFKGKNGSITPFYLYASPVVADTHPFGALYYLLMMPDHSNRGMPFTSYHSKELFFEQFENINFCTFEWLFPVGRLFWSQGIYSIADIEETDKEIGVEAALSIVHPADLHQVEDAIRVAIETGANLNIEFQIITPKHNVKLLHGLARVIKNEQGVPVKFAGSVRDITEMRGIEVDLKKKVEELNHTNRELEEFAYVASHDLQEPLRKITTFSERLSEKYKDVLTGDGLMYLSRMMASAENMRSLINDLLEFSRISKSSHAFEQVSLDTVVQQVKADLELVIEDTKTVINTPKLPEIEAVPSHMKQLIMNIVGNAIKFQKKDVAPEITITVNKLPDKEKQRHGLLKKALYYKFEITDNGIGFEEEYANRIFQVFQRLHGKSEYPGTGVGLAICKRILEYHNGVIYANSAPGQGATFTFILPERQQK